MRFPDPLLRGRLVRRYKRFLCDAVLDSGEAVVAHCANPGAMTGLVDPGTEIWLSPARSAGRKLRYSWELARIGDGLVGIDTGRPNAIVAEAIQGDRVPELAGYPSLRREVAYGTRSRVDLLLEAPGRARCFVEIKNVNLKRGTVAAFPDTVTARGARHMAELAAAVRLGHRAVVLFLVQREDCARFAPADDIDPAYAAAFREARSEGVEALCYSCRLTTAAIDLDRPLAIGD